MLADALLLACGSIGALVGAWSGHAVGSWARAREARATWDTWWREHYLRELRGCESASDVDHVRAEIADLRRVGFISPDVAVSLGESAEWRRRQYDPFAIIVRLPG